METVDVYFIPQVDEDDWTNFVLKTVNNGLPEPRVQFYIMKLFLETPDNVLDVEKSNYYMDFDQKIISSTTQVEI